MKNVAVLVLSLLSFIGVQSQSIVDASEIIEKINKGQDVIYENTIIEGDIDLTHNEAILYKNLNLDKYISSDIDDLLDRTSHNYFVEIDSKIEFINCEFEGDLIGYRVDEEENRMYNAKFNNSVTFAGCTFNGEMNFKYTVFEQETEIESSFIENNSNFKYAQFNNQVNFSGSSFSKSSDFNCAQFAGLAVFQGTDFYQKARFNQASFKDAVYFTETSFSEKALFTYAKFKQAVFNNAQFDGDGNFAYSIFDEGVKFVNAKFKDKATFDNAKYDDIDLEGTSFQILPGLTKAF